MMFHSCGAVREVIPELISCGVDILNPLQPAAKGMEPAGLKRDFGAKIAFHGGIDIQYLLPQKTAAEVAAEAGRVRPHPVRARRVRPFAVPQYPAGHAHGEHPGDVPHGGPPVVELTAVNASRRHDMTEAGRSSGFPTIAS